MLVIFRVFLYSQVDEKEFWLDHESWNQQRQYNIQIFYWKESIVLNTGQKKKKKPLIFRPHQCLLNFEKRLCSSHSDCLLNVKVWEKVRFYFPVLFQFDHNNHFFPNFPSRFQEKYLHSLDEMYLLHTNSNN